MVRKGYKRHRNIIFLNTKDFSEELSVDSTSTGPEVEEQLGLKVSCRVHIHRDIQVVGFLPPVHLRLPEKSFVYDDVLI